MFFTINAKKIYLCVWEREWEPAWKKVETWLSRAFYAQKTGQSTVSWHGWQQPEGAVEESKGTSWDIIWFSSSNSIDLVLSPSCCACSFLTVELDYLKFRNEIKFSLTIICYIPSNSAWKTSTSPAIKIYKYKFTVHIYAKEIDKR